MVFFVSLSGTKKIAFLINFPVLWFFSSNDDQHKINLENEILCSYPCLGIFIEVLFSCLTHSTIIVRITHLIDSVYILQKADKKRKTLLSKHKLYDLLHKANDFYVKPSNALQNHSA